MSKRYLVVGGVAGGASCAARIRRLDENAEILIFEKGHDISFSNCSLPNYLSREVATPEELIIHDPEVFKNKFNLEARVNSEVIKIMPEDNKVLVKDVLTGEENEDHYDYLVLSPGAFAVKPKSIKGIDEKNVFTVKNVDDIKKLDAYIVDNDYKDIAVIGGGFIGIEVAECLKKSGKNVSIVEAMDQVMMPFDYDMAQYFHKELDKNGVKLYVEEKLVEIRENSIVLESGKEIKADVVVMSIGVAPNIKFAVDAGIKTGETGAILVDHNYRTNYKNIYAVGDAIEVFHSITKKKTRLALAGPAQRQARSAADHMFGRPVTNKGVIGSSCIRIFSMNGASTGLNEKQCQKEGIDYMTSMVTTPDRVSLIPGAAPITLKLVFENPTGKILGAQAVGMGDVTKRIDVIAAMITMGAYLDDLKELELCYAPPFSMAKDLVNFAALVGLNKLNGDFKQVPHTKLRELVEEGAFIVDVRDGESFAAGHVKGAINIPLGEIRKRYSEIPKDVPVYLYCKTSWYAYYAGRALEGLGYDNITNIQGSFFVFSMYHYFDDKRLGRESVLTSYDVL